MTANYAGSREYEMGIRMNAEEYDALKKLGEEQLRTPNDVAFMLLRKALIREGAIVIPEKITGRG